MLEVEPGTEIYWEQSGSADGIPLLYLHGGPGSGLGKGGWRRIFDTGRHRLIGLDQRGSGRSIPSAGEHPETLPTNTTQTLIADIEALREHLGVERWIVTGISWGSTLALASALEHPERVDALVLAAVTTTGREEVEWLTEDMGRVFPEEWDRFTAAVPREPGERVVEAYARVLTAPDPAMRTARLAAADGSLGGGAHEPGTAARAR